MTDNPKSKTKRELIDEASVEGAKMTIEWAERKGLIPRQQDVTREVVVPLKEVEQRIPRKSNGDPNFEWLDDDSVPSNHPNYQEENNKTNVLDVFTPSQVVAIVNRWIYQAEYQRQSHLKRSQAQRDREKPVKEAFRRLFPGTSFINATEDQIRSATLEAYTQQKEKE